jgi:hypothetical protein
MVSVDWGEVIRVAVMYRVTGNTSVIPVNQC